MGSTPGQGLLISLLQHLHSREYEAVRGKEGRKEGGKEGRKVGRKEGREEGRKEGGN